jgi:hypothetical protein
MTGITLRTNGEPGRVARSGMAVPNEAWQNAGKRG